MTQIGIQFEWAQIITLIMAIITFALNIAWMRDHPKIWAYAFPTTFILASIIVMYVSLFLTRYVFMEDLAEVLELNVFFTQFSSIIRTITVGTLLIDVIWKRARERTRQKRYKEYINE